MPFKDPIKMEIPTSKSFRVLHSYQTQVKRRRVHWPNCIRFVLCILVLAVIVTNLLLLVPQLYLYYENETARHLAAMVCLSQGSMTFVFWWLILALPILKYGSPKCPQLYYCAGLAAVPFQLSAFMISTVFITKLEDLMRTTSYIKYSLLLSVIFSWLTTIVVFIVLSSIVLYGIGYLLKESVVFLWHCFVIEETVSVNVV